MANIPDDWYQYQRCCEMCGRLYHESEGFCDCEEYDEEEANADSNG